LTITTDQPALAGLAAIDPHDAALIAVISGGVDPFAIYTEATCPDGEDLDGYRWDLLEEAQNLAIGNARLADAVQKLIDVFWPPVDVEDVFPIAPYGVTEDYEPVEVAR